LTGDVERSLVGVRVGTVYHPAMLLAFADGSRLKQNGKAEAATDRETRMPDFRKRAVILTAITLLAPFAGSYPAGLRSA
jgi:hypothetical protein